MSASKASQMAYFLQTTMKKNLRYWIYYNIKQRKSLKQRVFGVFAWKLTTKQIKNAYTLID